jgi:hypothetical protein
MGLPLQITDGSIDIQNSTGSIFVGKGSYSYATDMSTFPGTLLIKDTLNGLTSSNRLLEYLRSNSITQSRITLVATQPVPTEFNVQTGIGDSRSAGVTNNTGGRIVYTSSTPTLDYGIKAKILIPSTNEVEMTFRDNFDSSTTPFSPGAVTYSQLPSSGPFINWFGLTSPNVALGLVLPTQIHFTQYFSIDTVQVGSGSQPSIVNINFSDNDQKLFESIINLNFLNVSFTSSLRIVIPNYKNEQFQAMNIVSATTTTFTTGFFSYNDSTSNPTPQPNPPARVIRYSVNGNAGNATPTGTISTLLIDIQDQDSAEEVALKSSNAINLSYEDNFDVVTTPLTGDNIVYPLDSESFVFIYWNLADAQPANPAPSSNPIYITFTGADTLDQISLNSIDAINESSVGIPYWPDLGLPPINNSDPDLSYFMVN